MMLGQASYTLGQAARAAQPYLYSVYDVSRDCIVIVDVRSRLKWSTRPLLNLQERARTAAMRQRPVTLRSQSRGWI